MNLWRTRIEIHLQATNAEWRRSTRTSSKHPQYQSLRIEDHGLISAYRSAVEKLQARSPHLLETNSQQVVSVSRGRTSTDFVMEDLTVTVCGPLDDRQGDWTTSQEEFDRDLEIGAASDAPAHGHVGRARRVVALRHHSDGFHSLSPVTPSCPIHMFAALRSTSSLSSLSSSASAYGSTRESTRISLASRPAAVHLNASLYTPHQSRLAVQGASSPSTQCLND